MATLITIIFSKMPYLSTLMIICIVSVLATYFSAPLMIRYLRKIGLNVRDMAKFKPTFVPISGGLIVLIGTFISLMMLIFIRVFFQHVNGSLPIIFASMCSMMVITFIGFLDDLLVKQTKGEYVGLKRWQKPLLVIPAAIPLMVVKAGTTKMILPFLGTVDFGLWYALLLVPIGVIGAANMVNMLAGFNGMETGLGMLYTGSLGLYALYNSRHEAAIIALAVFCSLAVFLLFNWTPANVLAGDSLTYLLGATIAIIAIVGNIEKAALICSIPFFIEFFLKLRGGFQKQSYGYALENGCVKSLYNKIYSIPHLFTRSGKFKEQEVTLYTMLLYLPFVVVIWFV